MLPEALPWVAFLPDPDMDTFVAEEMRALITAEPEGDLGPVPVPEPGR